MLYKVIERKIFPVSHGSQFVKNITKIRPPNTVLPEVELITVDYPEIDIPNNAIAVTLQMDVTQNDIAMLRILYLLPQE